MVSKSTSLIIFSLLKNIGNPGTFSYKLNKLHKMNGMLTLNLSRLVLPSLATVQSCFNPSNSMQAHLRATNPLMNPAATMVSTGRVPTPSFTDGVRPHVHDVPWPSPVSQQTVTYCVVRIIGELQPHATPPAQHSP